MEENERIIEMEISILRKLLVEAKTCVTTLSRLGVALHYYDNNTNCRLMQEGIPGHVIGRMTKTKQY